jgi:hypothetical protein
LALLKRVAESADTFNILIIIKVITQVKHDYFKVLVKLYVKYICSVRKHVTKCLYFSSSCEVTAIPT